MFEKKTADAPVLAEAADPVQTDAFYAPRPTRMRLFFRTFLPWQAVRFVVINLKMLGIIVRSHQG